MGVDLNIGEISADGKVEIVDKDRLCYLVKNTSKGATGIRIISRKLLEEFVIYLKEYPDASADEARKALTGNSDIDKFEYGYASTLVTMAKMVIEKNSGKDLFAYDIVKHEQPFQQIFYGAPGTGKSHSVMI